MPGDSESTGVDPLIECELPLGRPGMVVHDRLLLSGWAASPVGIAGVAVQIGERQWNAAYGLDTPALADRLPGVEGADRAGYRLAIDTSGWAPGPCVVTVAAFDRQGGRSAVEGAVEIRPLAESPVQADRPAAPASDGVTLSLESPVVDAGVAQVEGALDIRGWAYAREGVEAILVTLDDTLQYEALRPVARPDLLAELGRDVAIDAGFVLRIDPVDCPPGRHTLTVSALGRDGRAAGVECELECRAVPDGLGAAAEPPLAESEPTGAAEETWRSRALLAEADAALCRAEAQLARTAEERARRELRAARNGSAG